MQIEGIWAFLLFLQKRLFWQRKRIEYQQLALNKKIQQQTSLYYKQGYLPTLSAYYNYYDEYEHNEFAKLFNKNYPYSLFGLQLNIPIFAGMKRQENIKKSALQEERIDWDFSNLRSGIQTQYQQSLAAYKSSLYNLAAQRENEDLAKEVYEIVKLQYREGVKTYLDVIVAETDLRNSEINYLNALFQVLASKIDLEWAMGDIPTEI
jgi:outer membrane protein TolC